MGRKPTGSGQRLGSGGLVLQGDFVILLVGGRAAQLWQDGRHHDDDSDAGARAEA